nr:Chain F, Plasminogen [Homo sapiens]
KCPGRVVGGCK